MPFADKELVMAGARFQPCPSGAATAEWLFLEEKATLYDTGNATYELENCSSDWL